MSCSYLGGDFGRMVFKYESFEVQDPHALVLLRFGLRARARNIKEEIMSDMHFQKRLVERVGINP